MAKQYTSESLEYLTGLEPAQRRPGMYTDTTRPNHLAQEVIDNSVDESLAGFCSKIVVTLHHDGSLSVLDNGRGIPVDIHPKEKKPGVELILTKLHSGAKFSDETYKYSGGLHGVGISVVNALSARLEVKVYRSGKIHSMAFEHGKVVQKLQSVSNKEDKKQTGTFIQFWPEAKYFDHNNFLMTKLAPLLRAKAMLLPGLTVQLIDEQKSTDETWCFENGLEDFVESRVGANVVPKKPFVGNFEGKNEQAHWALAWDPNQDIYIESFVNLIPTPQGGTHVNGLRQGVLDAVRDFAGAHSLLPKNVKINGDDAMTGMQVILSVKLNDPQFAGQTKERLSSRECTAFVSGVVKDSLTIWLNQHHQEAKLIVEMVVKAAQKRQNQDKLVSRKKVAGGPQLPGKLADCSSTNLKETELFLVEGDSAGGSAKQARDRKTQAVMPLRGKILNTWEVSSKQILSSQEINDISVAIGLMPNCTDLTTLRYGKICILADADSDGQHIATLICALFLKHYPELVKAGHVYVAMPPLYRIDCGQNVFYALDDAEKEGVLERIRAEKMRGKVGIQRFKGLGEMNPIQLRQTTMSTDTRRLMQLTYDSIEAITTLDKLLAKKRASDRKSWLEENGDKAAI